MKPGLAGQAGNAKGSHRRRFWSSDEKGRMVAESFAPGASVSKVAQRYGVNAICCSPDGAGTREAQRAAAWTLSLAYDSLTDDGIQFVDLPRNGNGWTARQGGAPLRPDLARARHRTSDHQAKLPLDEWSGRANEQDHQGRHGQTLRNPPTKAAFARIFGT
jgi:Transposase